LSLARDPARAGAEAVEGALAQAGVRAADAAFVFTSGHGRAAASAARSAVERLGTRALAGVAAHGVLAGGLEEEEQPAVAVLALAGVEATPFRLADLAGAEDAAGAELEAALGRSAAPGDLVVLFADALALDLPRLLHALDEALPEASLVGASTAMDAGDGGALQWCGREVGEGGASGLVLHLERPARTLLSQGCRPIGAALEVTRVEGHWVLELDGRPALEVYRDAAGGPLAADLRRAAERLLVALPRSGDDLVADFVVRNVAGFAPGRGGFALAEELRVGARLRLALRDGDLAREDLAKSLAAAGDAPAAALYLSCPGRGQSLFRHAGLEAAYVARALEPAPVAGVFGSFQFGPVAGATERLTYAGVLALIG
jgi:small ligand-binding sensory domain FIST